MTESTASEPVSSTAKARMEATVADMLQRGYVEVVEIGGLTVGARVCHSGQRWYEARVHGTATVERIFHKPVSSWSQKYNRPDIEIIAKRDESPDGEESYGYWADYHTIMVRGEEDG